MVVGRDAILAGSPKFSGAVQVRLKKDVKNNGASPDKGKTRLNPTYAHTQGVSSAAGSLFFGFFKGAGHAKRVCFGTFVRNYKTFGPRPSLTAPTGSKRGGQNPPRPVSENPR